MVDLGSKSLLITLVALGITICCTFPALRSIHDRVTFSKQDPVQPASWQHYQDQDGAGKTESEVKPGRFRGKRYLISAVCVAIGSLCLSLASTILSTARISSCSTIGQWLRCATWGIITLQSAAIAIESSPTRRFNLCLYSALSLFCLLVVVSFDTFLLWKSGHKQSRATAMLALSGLQLLTGAILLLLNLLLPRRPDIFYKGDLVNRQYTTSFLYRLTFTWVNPLIDFLSQPRMIQAEDLPALNVWNRPHVLLAALERTSPSVSLWRRLVVAHSGALLTLAALVTVLSVLSLSPQLSLLGLLSSLEKDKNTNEDTPLAPWMWACAIGMSTFLSATTEIWYTWIGYSEFSVPLYEQLTATIFAKTLRRKNCGTAPEPSSSDKSPDNDPLAPLNLVAVDAKRVADFAASSPMIPLTILKTLLACAFLAKLIGWQSLLSGLGAFAILTPVNIYLSSKYSTAQITLMKTRDKQTNVSSEALRGMRHIKFYALEEFWARKVMACREVVIHAQSQVFKLETFLIFVWILAPVFLSTVSLGVYALVFKQLPASVAFTTLAIFGELEIWLALLPLFAADYLQAHASISRVDQFLDEPENIITHGSAEQICFDNATVAWPSNNPCGHSGYQLHQVSLQFPNRELSVVLGETGSGKSLLLSSMIRECDIIHGHINTPASPRPEETWNEYAIIENWILGSAVAYVAQTPWIEGNSIRDNILYGLPHRPERYNEVLFACALNQDLNQLTDGDLTNLGDNGVNLSGGQRSRISLARALYSRAGVLILDDIFSAVDAQTGRHILQYAITGGLGQGRTRILATHRTALCISHASAVVLLEEGSVSFFGSGREFILLKQPSLTQEDKDNPNAHLEEAPEAGRETPTGEISTLSNNQKNPQSAAKYIEEEHRNSGVVQFSVFKYWLKSGAGLFFWTLVLLSCLGYISSTFAQSWWVKIWTSRPEDSSTDKHTSYYVSIYVGLGLASCLVGTVRYAMFLVASIRASRRLFEQSWQAVLHAPLRWLDTVPLGRVLNRFTADFHLIDSKLGASFGSFVHSILSVLVITVAGFVASPVIVVAACFLLVLTIRYWLRYLNVAREMKRLESNLRSPVLEKMRSVSTGLPTIRAFDRGHYYQEKMLDSIDQHARALWHMWLLNRWFAFRLSSIGALFAFSVALASVWTKRANISAAGFALSFAMRYVFTVDWALQQYTNIEFNLNAVERVKEYALVKPESRAGSDVPAGWPTNGRVEVRNLSAGYSPASALVLQDITFAIEPNQRVGVVGRTGAGKSSLVLALFRLLEARGGSILLDGIDISKVKLQHLRSRLVIVPQDPFLFSGTIRSNLDPLGKFSDYELLGYLDAIGLRPPPSAIGVQAGSSRIFNSLDLVVDEGGFNLSHGQRQLICLARAIVSRPKILILDEATSSVDMETDGLIQSAINSDFSRNIGSVLMITHRIRTVAGYDQILVMDNGKLVEAGAPKQLLSMSHGFFKTLVEESGDRKAVEIIVFGVENSTES